LFTHYFRRVL